MLISFINNHLLGDVLVGHLELGEEDGAVLRPAAVYHRYDLVATLPPAQGPHVPQVLKVVVG